MDLTVVVASVASGRRIVAALQSILLSVAGLDAEVLVVDASSDGSADLAAGIPGVRVERRPPGTLVPHLWADGIRQARGRVVATTTGHTVVSAAWARALIEPFVNPIVGGVGGPMRLATDASALDAAVFFLRYSAFLPTQLAEGVTLGELAGDNAAYRRDSLLRDPADLDDGFWEVPYHRRLRQSGQTLVGRAAAVAEFGHAYPFSVIAAHRFRHGRQFAADRVASGERRPWQVLAAAAAVPALITFRAARRGLADPQHRGRLAAALPGLLTLGSMWATGEAVGAVAGPSPHEGRRDARA